MWIQRTRYPPPHEGQRSKWHLFAGFDTAMVMLTGCKKGGFSVTDDILISAEPPRGERCPFCIDLGEVTLPPLTFQKGYDKILSAQQIGEDLYQLIYTAPLPNYPNRKHRWDRE